MFIFSILIGHTYDIFISQKISNFIIFLICLNKLKINIGLLILLYLMLTFTNKRLYTSLLIVLSVSWKSKFIFFIKLFFFGFFKTHLLIFYSALLFISIPHSTPITLKFKNSTKLYMIVIAFILGGRWALYLYNWGYYWTNDSIEYIMLLFLLTAIWKIHKNQIISYYTIIMFVIPVYILILLRFSFIFTKHNFFQQNKLSYWLLKIILLIFFLQIISQFFSFLNKFVSLNFNLNFFVFLAINCLICSNKINYINIQKVVYFANTLLIIFLVVNFSVLKSFKLNFQHWVLMYTYLLLMYISTIYYVNIIYILKNNKIFNQFYNFYNFYTKNQLFSYILNNSQILKTINTIQHQQLHNSFLTKKFINFLI